MAKKKTKKKEKLSSTPTSYEDFRVMYEHVIEMNRSQHPSIGLGQALEHAGFDALQQLAEDTKLFVLATHAERYAPIPEYEASHSGFGWGGAGIKWYLKAPHDPCDQRTDAHGRSGEHYEMVRFPLSGMNPHSDGYINSWELDDILLWAEMFNMVMERRQNWREGVNQLL